MNRILRAVALSAMAAVASSVASSPARAVAPDNSRVVVDETSSFDDCGFTVETTVQGHINFHVFSDDAGNPTREIRNFALHVTLTNPATGETLSDLSAGPDIGTFNEDGSLTVASIGVVTRIVVRGAGLVAAQIGRIVLVFLPGEDTPEVIFEAGPHENVLGAICDALAQ